MEERAASREREAHKDRRDSASDDEERSRERKKRRKEQRKKKKRSGKKSKSSSSASSSGSDSDSESSSESSSSSSTSESEGEKDRRKKKKKQKDFKDMNREEKIQHFIELHKREEAEADAMLSKDERQRGYSAASQQYREVTEEEMEAYRRARKSKEVRICGLSSHFLSFSLSRSSFSSVSAACYLPPFDVLTNLLFVLSLSFSFPCRIQWHNFQFCNDLFTRSSEVFQPQV